MILSGSKFYFNYRHTLNVIMFYAYLKQKGITDDQIILMVPSDHACNPRNPFPATLYLDEQHEKNVFCDDLEIDYKAEDLTAESILNLLRGRYDDQLPKSKRIVSGPNTRIFIYFNGHGGENFFKIQDTELIHSEDLAKVLNEMHHKNLYKEIFFMIDTCQAMTLFDEVNAPNIYMLATSVRGESAIADKTDGVLNTFLSDKFSGEFYDFLTMPNGYSGQKNFKLQDFKRLFTYERILSHLVMKSTGSRPLSEV